MYKKNGSSDTMLDTIQKLVTEKINFKIVPRSYENKKGERALQLDCNAMPDHRWRLQLDIYVALKDWDETSQRVKGNSQQVRDANLYLANIEAKITEIFTRYRLMHKPLQFEDFKQEYLHGIPRVMVIPYMRHSLKESTGLSAGTRRRYASLITKISLFNPNLTFHQINTRFPESYIKFCEKKGNKKSTIASNCIAIKSFLKQAKKDKIYFDLDIDDFKVQRHRGYREYLLPEEMSRLIKYYKKDFIDPTYKLSLGYFLIGCFTGLRLGELKLLRKPEDGAESMQLISPKTGKKTTVHFTSGLKELFVICPRLCEQWIHENTINKSLKKIAKLCKINKSICVHVGRHTFAMAYLRKNGNIQDLQTILKHGKIDTTMVYVHQLDEEKTADLEIMGNLYD
jgi:integrase